MTQGSLDLGLSRSRDHLRLSQQIREAPRRRRSSHGSGPVNYPDQPAHAEELEVQLRQLRAGFAERVPVLGVDPRLVLVLEFTTPPDEERLRVAQLHVLDWFEDRVVVTASDEVGLDLFQQRLDAYRQGPRPPAERQDADDGQEETEAEAPYTERAAAHQQLFDCIVRVRPFEATEVPSSALSAVLANGFAETVRLDLQLWCPEDDAQARSQQDAVVAAIGLAGGSVLDRTLRSVAGLSLIRADISGAAVQDVFSLWQVRRADVLPRPSLGYADVAEASRASFPEVVAPDEDAPLLAVIDSGVSAGNPLIAPTLIETAAIGSLDEDADVAGHGTFVASLALYGPLERRLDEGHPLAADARLISVRVLDDDNAFPNSSLWEADLLEALELAAHLGAKVINVSIGDERRPFDGGRPTPLAAAVDEFIRERSVVVIFSTGNNALATYNTSEEDYRNQLLDPTRHDAGILDPATSALSLTVGALVLDDEQGVRSSRDNIDLQPVAAAGAPSPLTRRGPGVGRMVKPELVTPGGDALRNASTGELVGSNSRSVVGASSRTDRILEARSGTSFAAPVVANIAAQVWATDASLTANGVRALVLLSVVSLPTIFRPPHDAAQRREERSVLGFGRPVALRAVASSDHRAVLIAENRIPADAVHLYRVPVPSSFFEAGGERGVSIALAYDPESRSTRLVPLSSRMHVFVYFGASLNEVAEAFLVAATDDDGLDGSDTDADTSAGDREAQSGDGIAEESASGDGVPLALRSKLLDLQPSDQERGRGAHHYGTYRRRKPFDRARGAELVIAVRNVSQWPTENPLQSYALAIEIERDEGHGEVYSELHAFVEAEVQIPVLVETELEI